jgi:putative membrane protein
MMNWDGYHWQWGAAAFFMLLFWLVVLALVALLIRWLVMSSRRSNGGAPEAQRILDQRLARGEISVAEYRERSAALGDRHSR